MTPHPERDCEPTITIPNDWRVRALLAEAMEEELRAEVERLRALIKATVDCPLIDNACEHIRAMREALP